MNENRRMHLWTVALMVAAGVFLATVSVRQYSRLRELEGQLRLAKSEALDRDRLDQQIQQLNEQILSLHQRMNHEGVIIPARSELGPFLQEVAHLIEEQGLRPQEVQPEAVTTRASIRIQPVTFRVEGTGYAIYELIRGIEAMSRLTRFESFKAGPAADAPGWIQAEIRVNLFFTES